ncbi:MAG: hypothetical protein IE931_12590 [Sphingobacteriales bacterium]|nr:hypothetical protein [Sphingobacteriales bacterium]
MKATLSVLILSLTFQFALGQNKIEGRYVWADPAGLQSQYLEFNQSKVIYTVNPDLGNTFSLKGTFIQKGNLIKLSFNKIEQSSYFRITKNKVLNSSKFKFIKIEILDGEQNLHPIFGATVSVIRCKNSNIQISSDINGIIQFQTSKKKQIDSLVINLIGYESLIVPLKNTYDDVEISCVLYLSKNNGLTNVPNEIQIIAHQKSILDIRTKLIYKKTSN